MNSHLFLSLAIRSFAPPLIALMVVSVWRKSSASNRRMVWIMSFVALLVLPLALLKLPSATVVDYPQIPATARSVVSNGAPVSTILPAPKSAYTGDSAISPRSAPSMTSVTPASVRVYRVLGAWAEFGFPLWAFGAFVVVFHWFVGLVRLSRLRLQPVADEGLLNELETACRRVGLTTLPDLSTCSQTSSPMVFGHFQPHVVLPDEARYWTAEALQAVFLHECAHVKRSDWLSLMFSRVFTAIYWFNPLTWLAARQLQAECEAAADDTVLLSGVPAGSYAKELLRIATEVRPPAVPNSLALLDLGLLKKRIARVLESNRSRNSASRGAICLSLTLSLALSVAFGFTYQVVEASVAVHDGYARFGQGQHVRIIAIVKRTEQGTQAWNMRGELLPNSFPLPDRVDFDEGPQKNIRYVVFAHTVGIIGIEDLSTHRTHGTTNLDAVSGPVAGYGYGVQRIDDDSLAVANVVADAAASTSIRCRIWNQPLVGPRPRKPDTTIVFDHVPLNPTHSTNASPDLDVTTHQPPTDRNAAGALIGVVDLDHPEWGYWRPNGTPMPPINGVGIPGVASWSHPFGNLTRRIGLLFRSRMSTTDRVTSSDVSGVLLADGIDIMRTPSGRYDLDMVLLNPSLSSMRVISKVPQEDAVLTRVKLTQDLPEKQKQAVLQFFSNRIAMPAVYFAFDLKLPSVEVGKTRSLKFLNAHNAAARFDSVSTDWDDSAVAVHMSHHEKIVAANVLEHGYDYFNFPNVSLFPSGHRH